MSEIKVIHADCMEAMRSMEAESVDAIICDPPYGLEFMGRDWDAPWKQEGSVLHDPSVVGGFQDGNGGNPFSRSRIRYGGGGSASHGFQVWCEEWAREAFRVAKPGAHLVAFGGTRMFHRLACGIEDAGWEIRDCLSWLYGSGFPKSLDASKAIDKMGGESVAWFIDYVETVCAQRGIAKSGITALFPSRNGNMTGWFWNKKSGNQNLTPEQFNRIRDFLALPFADLAEAEREIIGHKQAGLGSGKTYAFQEANGHASTIVPITAPATDAARQWQGWGTALKPAWEPAILARKPLVGTVAANVLAHGTGAINVDACRIGNSKDVPASVSRAKGLSLSGSVDGSLRRQNGTEGGFNPNLGRWPANVALDEEAAAMLDKQTGERGGSGKASGPTYAGPSKRGAMSSGFGGMGEREPVFYGDSGGASRFFYTAKASRSERGEGNTHPTVKPVALMRWLVKLVCPPGGTVLDPFSGSGSTLLAAKAENINAIGIEREDEYVGIIKRRLENATPEWLRKVEEESLGVQPQEGQAPVPSSLDDLFGFNDE